MTAAGGDTVLSLLLLLSVVVGEIKYEGAKEAGAETPLGVKKKGGVKKKSTYPSTSSFRAREMHSSTSATAPSTGVEALFSSGGGSGGSEEDEEDDEEEDETAAEVEVEGAGRRRRRSDIRCCRFSRLGIANNGTGAVACARGVTPRGQRDGGATTMRGVATPRARAEQLIGMRSSGEKNTKRSFLSLNREEEKKKKRTALSLSLFRPFPPQFASPFRYVRASSSRVSTRYTINFLPEAACLRGKAPELRRGGAQRAVFFS